MKKLLFVIMVMAGVLGFAVSAEGSTRNNDPIREILGVDYTISNIEYTIPTDTGLYRIRRIETVRPLNLRNFTRDTWGNIVFGDMLVPIKTGEAIIVTIPNDSDAHFRNWMNHSDRTVLIINIGSSEINYGEFVIRVITGNIPAPKESIEYHYTRPCESCNHLDIYCTSCRTIEMDEIDFGMTLQYTSEYIKFYSTDAISHFIPAIVEITDLHMPVLLELMGIELTQHLTISYYEHEHWLTAYYPLSNLGGAHARVGGAIFPHRLEYFVDEIPLEHQAVFLHELIHAVQLLYLTIDPNFKVWHMWISEGTASYLPILILDYDKWHRGIPLLIESVRKNNIPTTEELDYRFRYGGVMTATHYDNAYLWSWTVTIMQFIHQIWGVEYIIEINRCHASWLDTLGLTYDEFTRQWHRWLRINYGDPSQFHSDPTLIGTWDRLGNQQSLSTFTERNARNVNTWAQDILRRRGTSHQRLTFNNNGRITATGVTGFGNTWTDGSINGRGYEIRTFGGVDYLFVNNQGLAAPRTGAGGPWTVFIRR
jgi:hypothetical protein